MIKYCDQWDSQSVKDSVSSFEPIFCDNNNIEMSYSQDNGKITGSEFISGLPDQNLVPEKNSRFCLLFFLYVAGHFSIENSF